MVVSDSTGNTKAGRRKAVERFPTILDAGDCVHHIHLAIKDITNLPEFKMVRAQHRLSVHY